MRKALKFALAVVVAACFSMPLTLLAQNQITGGSLSGRSVDVAGSGMSGERVELLRGTDVVTTTTTNGLGEWSFRGVEPGVYTVRMNVRGRIAGVRVTVENGQIVAGTMIVVPAATASPQIGALTNLLTLVPAASTGVISTTAATLQVVETAELSPTIVLQILAALPPEAVTAFASAVVSAIASAGDNAGTFSQYASQFQTIATTGVVPPSLPPPVITS